MKNINDKLLIDLVLAFREVLINLLICKLQYHISLILRYLLHTPVFLDGLSCKQLFQQNSILRVNVNSIFRDVIAQDACKRGLLVVYLVEGPV